MTSCEIFTCVVKTWAAGDLYLIYKLEPKANVLTYLENDPSYEFIDIAIGEVILKIKLSKPRKSKLKFM
jgi:hypothetical protein